jgi:ribonuclease HI
MSGRSRKKHPKHPLGAKQSPQQRVVDDFPDPEVTIYTDGGCVYNPGPGGYGVVLQHGDRRKELSKGFRRTTNNRMEIMAALAGLEALKRPCSVVIWSDSQYLVNAVEQGWAKRWQAHSWWRNRDERALNPDLWERLLGLCEIHRVRFRWLRGHAGHKENERCDQLAREAIRALDLNVDSVYEELHHINPSQ